MFQFSQEQVLRFRERIKSDSQIIDFLEAKICGVRAHFRVPTTGIATWGGFFVCPKHSVQLKFDISDPKHYVCPVDGEVLTGEPYEGAWWRILNSANDAACHSSALLYLLTQKAEYLELSRRLLVEYATYFPSYEIHGGIPYNNPGKVNAQTLCDAMWIKNLALGYDIIRDSLSKADCELIENNLMHPCGEFLMEYRAQQLHNHEIIADAAVGMLGLLLDNQEFLDFALDSKYGLKYQLEHGTLADGFWFEGTPSYHFFAMEQYILFELFAKNTPFSFFNNPEFAEILKFPLHLIQPDGGLPLLNDANYTHIGFQRSENIYELAYLITGDKDFAVILNKVYQKKPRNNIFSFFFGAEALPEVDEPKPKDYHSHLPGGSGLTTMHGPDGRFLLVKHSPHGGEHDHYDRLGIHFIALGKYAAPDIGTCLYGAPLHYQYYKNTLTNNTVSINGENQPPANCEVVAYAQQNGLTLLDTCVKWDGSYTPLDSLTIKQWSDEAYKDVSMRRVIAWYGDFFIELFNVEAPEECEIDWSLHVRGNRLPDAKEVSLPGCWKQHGAGQFLNDIRQGVSKDGYLKSSWDLSDGCNLDIHTFSHDNCNVFYATGPDNPSTGDISYLLQQTKGRKAQFINVICAYRQAEPVLRHVRLEKAEDGKIAISIERATGEKLQFEHNFSKA